MLQILAMLSQCATPTKCTRGCLQQHCVLKLHNFSVYGDSIPLSALPLHNMAIIQTALHTFACLYNISVLWSVYIHTHTHTHTQYTHS